jgi:RNA-directed DNA polymerase
VLITPSELLNAWQRLATKLDTEYGGDDTDFAHIQANPQAWCGGLAQRIAIGEYQPQALQPIAINKKSGGQRILLVPPLVDRLVHSALAHRLSNQLDARFSAHSYAYRPGTGVLQACESLRTKMDLADTGWVLDADILDCFDLIDHHAVVAQLNKHGLWQNQTAWHLRQYLRSSVNSAPNLGLHGPSCLV